ncbi:glycoside hydrolase family 13 protein [Actinomyces gaoshouyii]|uniref:glycoside hydrolase family 13 protein n=1 Tax=Actinomyces gaoshouyii TaxID=1960083 RepID=UPI0009C14FF0|nr:glycoside hydrolase family 13 protein [Actinomyces gaoshouyii]ARD42581.1 alpha-amylase [Actinomyces gaoshouyii]
MNTPAALADASPASAPDPDWWRDAVVYQIYPRSFADADGNGIGDLAGITDRAPYLASLGIDAVWLSPFYPSALADGGYDVDDYRDVAPEIGTLADFDRMVATLAAHGIRVMVDIVPNHTSNRHPWFRAALAGGPDAPERALYHVRPGTGEGGTEPPNDWMSMFGGPAWERIEDTGPDGRPLTGPGTARPYQWYLHIFAPEQPDLNWDHPRVRADFLATLRFWADRGVAGFRVDVAPGLAKDLTEPFRPFERIPWWPLPADGSHPLFDRDAVHAIYRDWRALLDSYDPPRFAVAEAGVWPSRRAAYAASLGQAFNFQLQDADFTAASFRWAIEAGLADLATTGSTTWVLGCHDTPRVATRLGFDLTADDAPEDCDPDYLGGIGQRIARRWLMNDGAAPFCDAALGRRRARAAAMVEMALPGSMYIYQGDELGLPEVPDIPEDRLADPIAHRMRDKEKGRDGCRVPLPWTAGGGSHGFGPDGAAEPHLPQPAGWGAFAIETQEAQETRRIREADGEGRAGAASSAMPGPATAPSSMLSLYRAGLALRRSAWAEAGREARWLETGGSALAFARGDLQCWIAFEGPVALPAGDVLLASAPLEAPVAPAAPEARAGGQVILPADAAAWIRVPS